MTVKERQAAYYAARKRKKYAEIKLDLAKLEERQTRARSGHIRRKKDPTRKLINALKNKLQRIKNNFRDRNIPYDITVPQLLDLYNSQKGRCMITGIEMLIGVPNHPHSISIDRIRSDGIYTISNIRMVIYQVNIARGMWSDNDLIKFCKDVLTYHRKTRRV